MTCSKFKVLLYSDGSHQAFSAAVYTSTLLKNMSNMQITIVRVHDHNQVPVEDKYSWANTWPGSPTSQWIKHVLNDADPKILEEYKKILNITNTIFFNSGYDVNHQELFSNTSLSDISDTADVIVDYAKQKSSQLIIMGTRGLSSLNGLIFGSLAHTVLNKSVIPVLLIKKLPQEFIDCYLLENV
jgi:nucleotide-binding universal stress UspA family protein